MELYKNFKHRNNNNDEGWSRLEWMNKNCCYNRNLKLFFLLLLNVVHNTLCRDSNWLRYKKKIHKKSIKVHAIKYPFTIYCSPKELSIPHTINFIYFILPICDNIKHSPINVPYHQFFTIHRRVNLFSPAPFTDWLQT